MGLSEKREQALKTMPIIKTDVFKSKDGKFLIHKTSIVHIKPMNYYKAIVEQKQAVKEETIEEDLKEFLEAVEA